MLRLFLTATVLLTATAAYAGQQEADSCAAGLSAESKTIYDATAPQVSASTDLRSVLTDTTKSLAMSGKVSRASAKSSAEAAAKCLEMLKS
ncbi:hypothetical protein [Microbaculum marinum]|uniref:Uncharacterized protein n=1 Tax=Microbaculum marinum TaxID=1764581 RepID=A0AAW9RU11_9HYPH